MSSHPVSFRSTSALALAVVAVLFSAGPAARAAELPGSGGVRVNGALVSAERVWQEYRFQGTLRGFIHNRPAGEVDAALFESVVRQLVNRELLAQEAHRLGYRLSDEDRAEALRLQAEAWKGEQNFRTAARMMGVPADFIVDRAAAALLRDRMAAAAVPDAPPAGDERLKNYYEEHLAAYSEKDPPLRYIYVARKEGRRAPDLFAEIAKAADDLRKAGKGYATLVAKYSEHPGAATGGAAPEGAPGRPRTLKEGRLTGFVPDETGWHLYLRDIEMTAPFDQVRDRVRRDELEERRKHWLAGTLERLAKQARVEHLAGPPPPLPGGALQGGEAGH